MCPFKHPNEKARRRDPRLYAYAPVMCPDDKKGIACPRGDACPYTHNVYEFW
jgi:ribosome modulation factor